MLSNFVRITKNKWGPLPIKIETTHSEEVVSTSHNVNFGATVKALHIDSQNVQPEEVKERRNQWRSDFRDLYL